MTLSPDFSNLDAGDQRSVDVDDWDGVYVVGDVHGCLLELEALLDRIDPADDDLVVFVGDLVRKGPNSRGVVELVRDRPNFLSVRGNNEEKLLRGDKTLKSLDDEHLDYLRSLPLTIAWEGTLVTHAGVDPRKPADEHEVEDLQNVRSMTPGKSYEGPFWYDRYEGPPRVFFGHTVLDRPIVREWAVGLDTGCVYGGSLTAYDWRTDDLVAVESDRVVVERKDSKFLNKPPGRA